MKRNHRRAAFTLSELLVVMPNLNSGGPGINTLSIGMNVLTIPRHGSRPMQIPTNWPASSKLPGSINMIFYDGHAALVPLEQLWQQEWHRSWQPPGKRPGLQVVSSFANSGLSR